MSTTSTVFITVPKYVALSTQATATTSSTTPLKCSLPKIMPAPPLTDALSTSKASAGEPTSKAKKRRLDHLSWEEKIQRKKLKNRVAAQTSRDRKKARMEEMENIINAMTEKSEILENKCQSLQTINNSLLEKNEKLDAEVEQLKQQLQLLQAQQKQMQHKIAACIGCESLLNGSAVSKNTDPQQKGSKNSQSPQEAAIIVTLAYNSSLPTLQDMLLSDNEIDDKSIDNKEFDAGHLEQLAESLLADITADLEADDRTSSKSIAQNPSGTERLLGSVVGTTTECLESGQHKNDNSGRINIKDIKDYPQQVSDITLENEGLTCLTNDVTATTSTADTVYGTYDAKTNSITIEMDDVAVPVNEAVEEIYSDDMSDDVSSNELFCPSVPTSPSHIYLNVTSSADDGMADDDVNLNFDPITRFIYPTRSVVSPLAKSPMHSFDSTFSDHGYESIMGSPQSLSHLGLPSSQFEPSIVDDIDWPSSFNDLFPNLI
uniref:X-box-binding protein 1 n=1 Tax=Glossina pallidipes TaxID=7398 RepID=A0A1B0ACV6_GLOPL